MSNRFQIIEFENILYRHEMYKKIFISQKDVKYLKAEYFYLLNRLKMEIKYLLLINDKIIKEKINKIFKFFLNNYNCTIIQRNYINNFLKMIN